MSFNSTTFVFYFVFVFFVYWALARYARVRIAFLLVMSCVFYMSWDMRFILLLLFSAALDFYVGRALFRTEGERKRKLLLLVSLTGNFGLLGFFKYFNFFAENLHAGLARLGLTDPAAWEKFDIVLPVGISFYTFQTLSYTLDIYRRQLAPTDSLAKFALFVAFFPQLVAGPIVRARELLPQLDAEPSYDDRRATGGVFLMLVGLVKKVVLADVIATELVDPVFARPELYSPLEIALGVWGALFQFYLDFSAYSDIAIGAAACLGFGLPLNFDRPFMAQTFGEFWRRWHITLSTFLRDYLFFPLGGTKVASALARFKNFMVTMLLAGLWHGAGWNFVIWGGMHGVCSFLSSEHGRRKAARGGERSEPPLAVRCLRRVWVFNLVALSMLFFRNGPAMKVGQETIGGVAGSLEMLAQLVDFSQASHGLSQAGLAMLALAALIHFSPRGLVFAAERAWLRLPSLAQACALVAATGILAAVAYQQRPFIYFQF
jgi:D-alanyl-lipoteichoic acid acyltransferase DltB (MBOAT superfamily)